MVGSVPSSRADAGGQLLRELEALSQALYKAKGSRKEPQDRALLTWHSDGADLPDFLSDQGSVPAAAVTQQLPIAHQRKKKGGSLWDWKPLRALAHIGQTRFGCEFVAHVHGISKLPASLEGLRLQVRLKHKESEARTVPSLVFKGCADFEEALRIKCAVYGSSSSSGGVRYTSKTFTLSVVAPDASELELGKHRLDLSRILPDDSSARGSGKKSSWNTSFKLSGRAKGGILVVTFGYEMDESGDPVPSSTDAATAGKFSSHSPPDPRLVRSFSSLPSSPQGVIALSGVRKQQQKGGGASPAQSEPEYSIDVENLNLDDDDPEEEEDTGTAMTMSSSSGLLAPDTPGRQQEQELKEFSMEQSDDRDEDDGEADFSVVDQGVEESSRRVEESFFEEDRSFHPESEGGELDDEAEKFLHMLGTSSDDEGEIYSCSPRGLLLRQFEEEQALLGRNFGGGGMVAEEETSTVLVPYSRPAIEQQQQQQQQIQVGSWGSEEDDDLSAFMDAAEMELQKAAQAARSKARAKLLEDAEAEALMQEWGLNERAFQRSPPKHAGDFSAASALAVIPSEPPCLADGLGSMIPTRDGGSLRTMNPIHFQGGRNDGRLVIQVSKPVVVPAEMGSGVLDIFRSLAAGGSENMALQVMETMPLEDITGKNIYQIAMEGQASLEGAPRYPALGGGQGSGSNRLALEYGHGGSGGLEVAKNSSGALFDQRRYGGSGASPRPRSSDDTFMSLEDLAPVAMEKIEALAMQGLKIQSDMAEEEAPYAIEPGSSSNLLEGGGSGSLRLIEAAPGQDHGSESGLMAMSISLDEWMRLDAGVYDEAETTDKTKAVLAAHHAAHSTDIVLMANASDDHSSGSSGKRVMDSSSSSSQDQGGLMGDTLTLAMLVQLRDPLRNFEPVGAPMMAFVQAERVLVPPRPKMFKRVSIQGNSEVDEEELQQQQQGSSSQFKITGVHMAGLKSGDSIEGGNGKKRVWGTQKQQQSGSRWLLAHGMGKTGGPKHPLLKTSKNPGSVVPPPVVADQAPTPAPAPAPAPAKKNSSGKGESLWSISARVGSKAAAAATSSITRNPDVKFGSRLSLGKKKW
ncbi:protein PLASTID MOVEMENT IMPAIRED 1-RELATED 1 [Selaginella moellendorffii]|uniref:protein PLASTID MOVEMENT IMPAIRED 1-RELATED 1 n=1 Tax=Selaginella moellendorffii TaxID=88036 RepID=UPI000D1D0B2F|nr:protein PLASTID MOVEMENT IMPAIRED 1-RELATED 1 [Selaginella moellendorffii]|eukprot:XP_024521419.1 protein PLASTID MOVEMENT IMPAIRED 1-RELATED 1 [Selaginella moellendorffii]